MILAVDTSCYTTSMVALSIETGEIHFEFNRLLKVPSGNKGLRQSDGFYQHVFALNDALKLFCEQHTPENLKCIAVTNRPRAIEGSYMPVFNAGVLFCENLALALKVPLYFFSHQEGHIMAAVVSSGLPSVPKAFYAMHVSGGTTELLRCAYGEHLSATIIGESLDLHFGQLIDRIGVKLGLDFPAGKALDTMSQKSSTKDYFKLKFKKDFSFNLSGLENKYMALMDQMAPHDLARHLFNTIAHVTLNWAKSVDEGLPIIISGGVAANQRMRDFLHNSAFISPIIFAKPEYSRDNALGTAELGRQSFLKGIDHV